MELGADGVQLGKFVTTEECDVAGVHDVHLYQFPRGRHRNHRQPGRNAGRADRRGVHPPGARRADPSEENVRSTASRPATTPKVPTALSWRCTMRPKATCPADTLSQEPMRSCPKDHERPRTIASLQAEFRAAELRRNAARCRYNARQDGRPPVFKTVFGDISYLWVSFLFDTTINRNLSYEGNRSQNYPVLEMSCASCAMSVEQTVRKLPGVTDASVNFASNRLSVDSTNRRSRRSKSAPPSSFGIRPDHRRTGRRGQTAAGRTQPLPAPAVRHDRSVAVRCRS